MADLLIAPYLPITERADVNGWTLLPVLDADAAETVSNEDQLIPSAIRRPVRRLVDAYRAPDHPRLGAIIAPPGGEVGAPVDREAMRPLSRALLAGAVSANPDLTETEDSSMGGWSMLTAENALMYGHPNIDGDTYAVEIGVLQRVLSARHAESDEPLPKISPPVELPVPMIPRYDTEVAAAAMAALQNADASARRLRRALDWYAVVLSNAEAITLDVRVGAARSALEVLTNSGNETRSLVRSFGRLMGGDGAGAETRENVFWAGGPVQLTPDEWWLTRVCELRNSIVHGDEVEPDLWQHEGHHQLDHIHDRLVAAMRRCVADAVDDPLLEVPLGDRSLRRATQDFLAQHEPEE